MGVVAIAATLPKQNALDGGSLSGPRIAVVDADRCVHSHVEVASCQACARACPVGALELTDDALTLDGIACDGCGLCTPVCPQAAIQIAPPCEPLAQGASVRVWACERVAPAGVGVMPCIHALGLGEILADWRDGVRSYAVATSECASCDRMRRGYSADAFQDRVAAVNRLCLATGGDAIAVNRVSFDVWEHAKRAAMKAREALQRPNRRAFFQIFQPPPLVPQENSAAAWQPPGTLVPARSGSLLPWAITLDAARCTGCNVCANVCPNQAIRLEAEPVLGYVLDAKRCTGCRICVDTCEEEAVRLDEMTAPSQDKFELIEITCSLCRNPFHAPKDSRPTTCLVCKKINHRAHLHQVL